MRTITSSCRIRICRWLSAKSSRISSRSSSASSRFLVTSTNLVAQRRKSAAELLSKLHNLQLYGPDPLGKLLQDVDSLFQHFHTSFEGFLRHVASSPGGSFTRCRRLSRYSFAKRVPTHGPSLKATTVASSDQKWKSATSMNHTRNQLANATTKARRHGGINCYRGLGRGPVSRQPPCRRSPAAVQSSSGPSRSWWPLRSRHRDRPARIDTRSRYRAGG